MTETEFFAHLSADASEAGETVADSAVRDVFTDANVAECSGTIQSIVQNSSDSDDVDLSSGVFRVGQNGTRCFPRASARVQMWLPAIIL